MSQHFKVHDLLSREELDKLEAFAREPGRTVDECREWLLANGFNISRTAVFRWVHKFRMEDRFRTSAEMTANIIETAKREGLVAINDANALQLSVKLQEKLLQLEADPDTPAKELLAVSMALKNVINAKRDNEQLKKQQADAVAAAEVAVKEGKSATDVVGVIKQALGIGA